MKKLINNLLFILLFSLISISEVSSKNKATYEYLDLFGQIFDRVRTDYVDDVTDEELIEKAIDGMLTGLDPHSGYMNTEKYIDRCYLDFNITVYCCIYCILFKI